HVLDLARTLHTDTAAAAVPAVLLARLNQVEAALVTGIAAEPVGAAPPLACAQALKRLRFERERAEVQQEIDRLQDQGAEGDSRRIEALWQRKMDLVQRIETLST
ncbi:MAG: dnaG, partial [Acidobacteria bacterium]|nr:dnaG [Acidobacteriota bacterium]